MNTSMNLQRISVDRLKPAKYNPRKDLKPGDPAYEKIKRSLHEFGYVDPVIWNEVTGNIVGGHQRYKVLTAEGATEIDCVVVHIENPQEEKALNIALNKAVGEWEPVALADLLNDLKLSGYDVDATGFDAAEIDDLFSRVHDKDVRDDDCDIDPEQIEPFVQPGDIWLLGKHRMMCGDSTSEADVARLMDGDKANLVVTDPPYNVSYESADGKKIQNDSMADGQFYEFLLAAFRNMAAHMAEGGSAYIFHADTEGLNFRRAFKEAGFHISGVCIWVKNSLVLGRSPYQWQHEPVLFGWLPNGKHRWFADRKQSTIWNFDKPKRSKEHPTMKPIPLLAYPIKNSSAPNSIVLDLFGGSGSTLMACEQTDRICRTMELDPKYATAIVRGNIQLRGFRVCAAGNSGRAEERHRRACLSFGEGSEPPPFGGGLALFLPKRMKPGAGFCSGVVEFIKKTHEWMRAFDSQMLSYAHRPRDDDGFSGADCAAGGAGRVYGHHQREHYSQRDCSELQQSAAHVVESVYGAADGRAPAGHFADGGR